MAFEWATNNAIFDGILEIREFYFSIFLFFGQTIFIGRGFELGPIFGLGLGFDILF